MSGENMWQPIETAPKDGTEILVLINSATVWVAHLAYWNVYDDDFPEDLRDEQGWWSYTRHSVSRELLDEYSRPLYWMPFAEPEGWKLGIEGGPPHLRRELSEKHG